MDENNEFKDLEKDDEVGQAITNEENNINIPEDIYINRVSHEEEKEVKKSFKGSLMSYIALAIVASLIGGLSSAYIGPSLYGKVIPNPKTLQYDAQPVNINTSDDINAVSAVAKKAMSSVVGITTIEVQDYLFSQREVEGIGSGVIVDTNGYILTNSHVVGGGNAKSITVLFENGDKLPGKVLWTDPALDLAVVKVDATNLPVATLGDSDSLEVGEISVAIGNPLGLEFQRTVTSGIISGLNRAIQVDQNTVIENLIQTDASINPGNSGGPLLNSKGEVIGINTAKIKSAEGLGFSIPINEIKPILDEVLSSGTYKTVFMGISGVTVEEYESRLGVKLSAEKGIILIEISDNSPASRAGLLNGDIITQIDDMEIETMNQLKKSLYRYKKDDKATIKIIRNNTEINIDIEFTDLR